MIPEIPLAEKRDGLAEITTTSTSQSKIFLMMTLSIGYPLRYIPLIIQRDLAMKPKPGNLSATAEEI